MWSRPARAHRLRRPDSCPRFQTGPAPSWWAGPRRCHGRPRTPFDRDHIRLIARPLTVLSNRPSKSLGAKAKALSHGFRRPAAPRRDPNRARGPRDPAAYSKKQAHDEVIMIAAILKDGATAATVDLKPKLLVEMSGRQILFVHAKLDPGDELGRTCPGQKGLEKRTPHSLTPVWPCDGHAKLHRMSEGHSGTAARVQHADQTVGAIRDLVKGQKEDGVVRDPMTLDNRLLIAHREREFLGRYGEIESRLGKHRVRKRKHRGRVVLDRFPHGPRMLVGNPPAPLTHPSIPPKPSRDKRREHAPDDWRRRKRWHVRSVEGLRQRTSTSPPMTDASHDESECVSGGYPDPVHHTRLSGHHGPLTTVRACRRGRDGRVSRGGGESDKIEFGVVVDSVHLEVRIEGQHPVTTRKLRRYHQRGVR